jgi:hypothetical protein
MEINMSTDLVKELALALVNAERAEYFLRTVVNLEELEEPERYVKLAEVAINFLNERK